MQSSLVMRSSRSAGRPLSHLAMCGAAAAPIPSPVGAEDAAAPHKEFQEEVEAARAAFRAAVDALL